MSAGEKKKLPKKVVLQDSPSVKYVIVELDMGKNRTRILSGLNIWANIRVFASAIGMSYSKLINDGSDPRLVYKQLENIIVQMLQVDYSFEPTKAGPIPGPIKKERKVYTNGDTEIKTTKDGKTRKIDEAIDKSRKRSTKTQGTADSKQPVVGNNKQKAKKPEKDKGAKDKSKK